ncbi:MAG: hypothetical protein IE920_11020, partial [Thiotrichales bacterium]|nr:hypothetical protein [Thiotrichales bacterium]
PLAVDDSDLDRLLPGLLGSAFGSAQANNPQEKTEEKAVLHPLDDGSAILLALLLPFALAFRRGWLLSLTLLLTLPLGTLYAPPSFAKAELPDITDVFQTPDQQGYKAWQKKDYAAAEALFENSQWKGSALYENGKYKANLDIINRLLEQQSKHSANSRETQNSANSRETPAPEKQPNAMQDTTPNPENTAQNGEKTPSAKADKQQTARGESPNKTQQAGSEQGDKPPAAPADKQAESPAAEGATEKAASANRQKPDEKPAGDQANAELTPSEPTQQGKALTEQKQATQNWLQQIPDEPGLFLKRKFQYQFDNAAHRPAQMRNSADSRENDPTHTKNSANSRESEAGKKIW